VDAFGFREIWVIDFEFRAPAGENPDPICLVARELRSGRLLRLWKDDLIKLRRAPYPTGSDSLIIAYYASAEMGCHLALGWPLPELVLDLYVEFRNATNGRATPSGSSLLGASIYFGLDCIAVTEKEEMRNLAMRGGPYTEEEKRALLDYCQSDVDALERLFLKIASGLDVPRAILRGRSMKAAARIEATGIPIDTEAYDSLQENWESIQLKLIKRIDVAYGVFDGLTFREQAWKKWLEASQIPWPRLASGRLALDDDTFKTMANIYPAVAPIRELRASLSEMRLSDLAVGRDKRNRTLLSAFRARTGRNQPSNSKFIFGPAVWLRSLIRPEPGSGMSYIDWSQQEFGIAAALSGDGSMMAAYASGDPYLEFAKQAGAVPNDATKESHGSVRELFKACALAVQYGMQEDSLAARIGRPPAYARELLNLHHRTYRTFWRWSDAAVDYAFLRRRLFTVFGWNIHVSADSNPRSIRNFPMQANGAEMLRLACCLATEAGIRVCAPIHDAVLIEAPLDELENKVILTQRIMTDASEVVLDGFRLRSDAKLFRYPDRYRDARGDKMWNEVWKLLKETSRAGPVRSKVLTARMK
jgi:DNA polymerase-1